MLLPDSCYCASKTVLCVLTAVPACCAGVVLCCAVQIEAQQLVEAETAQARELERSIAAAEVRSFTKASDSPDHGSPVMRRGRTAAAQTLSYRYSCRKHTQQS